MTHQDNNITIDISLMHAEAGRGFLKAKTKVRKCYLSIPTQPGTNNEIPANLPLGIFRVLPLTKDSTLLGISISMHCLEGKLLRPFVSSKQLWSMVPTEHCSSKQAVGYPTEHSFFIGKR